MVRASGMWPVDEERGWVGQTHRRTDAALGNGLRPQQASIVRGMLIGDRSRIPEETYEDFRRSGVAHILAISGQHVAVLAAAVYFALRAFAVPAVVRNPSTMALIWLYVLVAGAPPSALRAGFVATLALSAPLFGRQLSPLHFMTTMLAAVLSYNPALVYSTGFQLSVAAVFGILLFRKPLKSFVKSTVLRPFRRPSDLLLNLISISLAAQVATAPIIAVNFEQVPVLGVFTNLAAVPLSAPILTLGFLGASLGNVASALAYPLNVSNGFLVTLLEWTAGTVASVPFAAVETTGATLPLVALFYAGCVPGAVAESLLPESRWPMVAGLLLLWAGLWVSLVAVL
ncbi:MAG: ComEC/Rec2 family competence protein [Rubrobacter sp.]|nr:ComEC/Rec2 family competence protein [Rubrobacter sp.]